MSIFDEVQQLEELTVIGKALIKYAISIEPGLVFERQDGWWSPSIEKNFIGFQFHWTDMLSIKLNLYGSVNEQFVQDDLIIKKARFGYSRCRVTDESQLMAATVCIWRAHQLFHRERHIETGSLVLIDQFDSAGDNPAYLQRRLPQHQQNGDQVRSDPAWQPVSGSPAPTMIAGDPVE